MASVGQDGSPVVGKFVPTIGVFTSGGDASGMNAAIRAVIRMALHGGSKVFAILEGYQGLVDGGDKIIEADWGYVGGILAEGGTKIGSARCMEFKTRAGRLRAAGNLVKHKIDTLVVIGGDGSLTGADVFRREWSELLAELALHGKITEEEARGYKDLTVVGLVGSIDNDMCGTEVTIGADSALHRIASAIDAILSTAASHRRSFVVEVMGRDCGYLALLAGLSTGADWVIIPEIPPEDGWETKMVSELNKGRELGRRCSLVILSEGARTRDGTPISSTQVCKILSDAGHDARVTILGHVQRGGTPSVYDRNMSTLVGAAAIEAAFSDEVRGKSCLIGMRGHKVIRSPLMECVEQTWSVPKAIAAKDYQKAMSLRGPGFVETYDIIQTLHRLRPRELDADHRQLRIGILHAGALGPGMNATVRALVRLGLDKGHKVYGIQNGFEGLLENNIQEMEWMSVNGWVIQAGAKLGISRIQTKGNIAAIAQTMKHYKFDSLIMVGGYDGYESMLDLYNHRNHHPEFDISMICIPATISNNCPCTEVSVGADTALNNIVDALDKIRESAVSSQRVFVVEVMGSDCGYLALMSALASGAERAYIPEEGITLENLRNDLEELKFRFQIKSKEGKKMNHLGMLIRNENANKTFSTEFVYSLLKEEGKKYFDVRQTILGHLQQGGRPSPFDRNLGARYALHAINFIHDAIGRKDGTKKNPEISAAFGVSDGVVIHTNLEDVTAHFSSHHRRPKDQWWMTFNPVVKILGQSGPSRLHVTTFCEEEERKKKEEEEAKQKRRAGGGLPYPVLRTWTIPTITLKK